MEHLIQASGAYSSTVPPLLQSEEPGYVHSIFKNGWNVRCGNGLIFIGSRKNGELPFGIHLEDDLLPQLIPLLSMGETFLYDREVSALLFSSFAIKLDPLRAYDSKMRPIEALSLLSGLNAFASEICTHNQHTGTGILVSHFLERLISEAEPFWSEHEQKIIQLMDAAQSESLPQIDKILRYWMGRGNGLTPAGDDMLAGMLAVDTITGVFTDHFRLHLSTLVEKEALTTDISREYLKYALQGQFSSVISNVLNPLALEDGEELMKRTRELLCVGHSSGLDTSFGILIGMLILRRNPTWHRKS
ncbi:DUF2877 domain-containing protein [Paenibacillus lutimineralis]|uniref:DUF2877 domain-containing protein n=1 Tax=Paenibacillus lutimineralis TaxID=2707005 RepID=A0A3Q9I5X3_9BACL|nr:DUF2877 domain-containing protein [Paenibacillus lutimineralis]AZS13404.1 DUF2877 domain-containing protein [Paenibacillus lutimineralis]